MNLMRLWQIGLLHPARAFDAIRSKPAPQWGFWIVVFFNVIISLVTILPLVLLGHPPLMPSALTFLPTESYLAAEIFFLPILRVAVYLLGAAIIHVGLRLLNRTSDIDQILNIGGLATLIVMPPLLLSDWSLIVLNRYDFAIVGITHPLITVWGLLLCTIGLTRLLGVETKWAFGLSLVSQCATIPLLAIFAR